MGLDNASIKFCCSAVTQGLDFSRTLMIGRQWMYCDQDSLAQVFAKREIDSCPAQFIRDNKYGDAFFSLLGAKEVQSLDYSDYEGASIIHDMNAPVPESLKEKFSIVYDGGSLEHVFNIPQALKNCMEMIKVGGHFMQVNNANNLMGHGFWQFSPELMFRVFSEENGFKVKVLLLHELAAGGDWYVVSDPEEVRQRVELRNDLPTLILTAAERVSQVPVFTTTPQQSDYSDIWKTHEEQSDESSDTDSSAPLVSPNKGGLKRFVPTSLKQSLRPLHRKLKALKAPHPFDKPYFRKLSEENLLQGKIE